MISRVLLVSYMTSKEFSGHLQQTQRPRKKEADISSQRGESSSPFVYLGLYTFCITKCNQISLRDRNEGQYYPKLLAANDSPPSKQEIFTEGRYFTAAWSHHSCSLRRGLIRRCDLGGDLVL